MERAFDNQIEEIKKLVLTMGGFVEKALEVATQALVQRDIEKFKQVHEIEIKINEEHMKVDNACVSFLAKQGPVAKDLRLVISVIKINTDLERMGDQCVNISHTGKDHLARSPIPTNPDILKMAGLAQKMVSASLDSFVREDAELAQKILMMDDEIDDLKRKVFKELSHYMKSNPADIEAALDHILIARNLERMGDHATNIAEDVIFVSTGKDVRHGGNSAKV